MLQTLQKCQLPIKFGINSFKMQDTQGFNNVIYFQEKYSVVIILFLLWPHPPHVPHLLYHGVPPLTWSYWLSKCHTTLRCLHSMLSVKQEIFLLRVTYTQNLPSWGCLLRWVGKLYIVEAEPNSFICRFTILVRVKSVFYHMVKTMSWHFPQPMAGPLWPHRGWSWVAQLRSHVLRPATVLQLSSKLNNSSVLSRTKL